MLYIGRITDEGYIVTDSDDNVETLVTNDELQHIVNTGIIINGVKTSGRIPNKVVTSVSRYVTRDSKVKAFKSMFVLGAEVFVDGDYIHAIRVEGKRSDPTVVLRLFNFASKCHGDVLSLLRQRHRPVVLVFDDKLEWHPKMFAHWPTHGVVLDIREVSDNAKAKSVYDTIVELDFSYEHNYKLLSTFIVDKPNRMSLCMAVAYIEFIRKCRWSYSLRDLTTCIPDFNIACELVAKYYKKEFEDLSNHEFQLRGDIVKVDRFEMYLILHRNKSTDARDWPDYSYSDLFPCLRDYTFCSPASLHRLATVVCYFRPSEELFALYRNFCIRAHQFLLANQEEILKKRHT